MARFKAQVAGDTAALRNLLGDELVYTHSNGLTETKTHFLETIATRKIGYDSLVPVTLTHRVYGEAAVGHGKVRAQVQIGGQTIKMGLLFATVHVKRGNRWQLVAWQSTKTED
jgi:hypothetical protein